MLHSNGFSPLYWRGQQQGRWVPLSRRRFSRVSAYGVCVRIRCVRSPVRQRPPPKTGLGHTVDSPKKSGDSSRFLPRFLLLLVLVGNPGVRVCFKIRRKFCAVKEDQAGEEHYLLSFLISGIRCQSAQEGMSGLIEFAW